METIDLKVRKVLQEHEAIIDLENLHLFKSLEFTNGENSISFTEYILSPNDTIGKNIAFNVPQNKKEL